MDEEKYTWEDLIFNPTTDESKSAIGKEVYYSDKPSYCIDYANENNKEFLGVLDRTEKSNNPFYIKESINWACIIVKKEEPYSERAKKWVEANDIKVGDYVKVTRKANEHEHGWKSLWLDDMDESVAKTLMVKDIGIYDNNIGLEDDYYYPYFVLEKTEPPKHKYVPFEAINEFLAAYYNNETEKLYTIYRYIASHGIWLKHRESDDLFMVVEIWDDGVVIGSNQFTTSWNDLSNDYTFLDGSPCGKEVEDE